MHSDDITTISIPFSEYHISIYSSLLSIFLTLVIWSVPTKQAAALPTLRNTPREYLRSWASNLAWLAGVAALFPALPHFMQILLLWWYALICN
jgi:hypothetical protein